MSILQIPEELKAYTNWVGWRWEERKNTHGELKLTKPPYDLKSNGTLQNASTSDPTTWTDFTTAIAAVDCLDLDARFDGIGLVLPPGIGGVDFDGVIVDEKTEPYVLEILKHLGDPYTEVSPSGNGLRAFINTPTLPINKGSNFKGKKDGVDKYGAEFYIGGQTNKYLTVTGTRFSGSGISTPVDINFVHFLISQFGNEKFKKLWMGDIADYGDDHSVADLALASLLAHILRNDRPRIEKYFSASVLGHRDKWTERADYRKRTIDKAISGKDSNSSKEPNQSQSAGNSSTRTLTLTRGDTIKMRKISWLWKGRLVVDGLNGFSGEPGVGKSTVASDILAAITRGRNFPDGAVNELGSKDVLIICDEEGREDVIVPRLTLAGADLTRVWFLDIETHHGQTTEQAGTRLDEDLPLIEEQLREHSDIILILPDPVTEYFGDANPNLDQEVGPIYTKMLQVSKRHHVAWLLISHFNKDRQATSTNRNSGAKVMVTKPRCNWLFAADPKSTEGRCLMLQGKCNLAKAKALAFFVEVQNVTVEGDGSPLVLENITRVRWNGETSDKADDVLLSMSDPKDRADTKVKAFLDDVLAEGPRRAVECYKLGEAQGIYEDTFKGRGISKGQIKSADGRNEWWWAKSKLELDDLRKQLTSTHRDEPSDDGVLAFLDGVIGNASMPVDVVKSAAASRGLNWETVKKSRQRHGYESLTTDQVRCWRKTPSAQTRMLVAVEGEEANVF